VLLERGADPNATRSDGTPAIVIAAMRRDASLVDELLAGGAEVDAADASGRTALMHAVERGADGIVASLLCAGANKDTKAADGSSAHTLALAWGRQRIRFMMGEKSVGLEILDAPRTVVYQRAGVVQLLGDTQALEHLAMLVDHAIDSLGDNEFETLVGASAEQARRVTDRLRHAHQDHPQSRSLKQLDITGEEQTLIRGAPSESRLWASDGDAAGNDTSSNGRHLRGLRRVLQETAHRQERADGGRSGRCSVSVVPVQSVGYVASARASQSRTRVAK
jgi:uncharacterized protein